MAPAIRESGFQIEFPEERKKDGFHVIISKSFKTSTPSTPSTPNITKNHQKDELDELHVLNPNLFENKNIESIGNIEIF